MLLVPIAALAAVSDSAPAETTVSAASSTTRSVSDAELASARVDEYATPESGRSSRTRSALAAFSDANPEPTTTTTEPPTTTTTTARPKPTTTTTARPKPTTTTTAAPKVQAKAVTTTTAPKPTTTTTAPKPTTTTSTTAAPASTSGGHEEGGASYHDYADARTCAHKTIAKGTVLTVTNLANGKKTTCVVNDRGPYVEGRILDLSTTAFSSIASVSDGVIRVAIDW
jgi:rare lipoprotein A (peptidoglycan hydrolase)